MLAQGVALAWLGGAGTPVLPFAAAAAALCALAWHRRARVAHLDVVVATVAFGGWGMLAGAWAATALTTPVHAAGMTHAHAAPGAWSAATGVMLLACGAGCRWSCAPLYGGGAMRRTLAHLLAATGMLAGMAAGGALLAPALAPLTGAAAGTHLAMVLGMAAGVAAVLSAAAGGSRAAARIAPGGVPLDDRPERP